MKFKLTTIVLLILGISFLVSIPVLAEGTDNPFPIPGRTQGIGTFFEIKDSQYLNISLESDQEIKVILESVPKMLILDVVAAEDNVGTVTLILKGLQPNITYYKYQNSYKNEAVFITDENGNFTWSQDLSQPLHIWIQEKKGTIFLPEDCSAYGIWDAASSTCTLNRNLTESVEITINGITLDCANHKIETESGGYGIYLNQKENITIKNCSISRSTYGVHVGFSSQIVMLNNILSSNYGYGLNLAYSSNSEMIDNIISLNGWNGIRTIGAKDNLIKNNHISLNNYEGIDIDKSALTSPNEIEISRNTITENTISFNGGTGIHISYCSDNYIYHNNFINNYGFLGYQAYQYPSKLWDSGYPSGGNYWSNYTGEDFYSGPFQNQLGSDGIGDTPYNFPYHSQDRYPFMNESGWEAPEKWSFAIITDLHVGYKISDYGNSTWNDNSSGQEPTSPTRNLRNTIAFINSNKEKYNIDFVVVLGDFTESAELSELNKAKEILNGLQIPWIPLPGNHDVWPYTRFLPSEAPEVDEENNGADKFFNDIFNFQYEKLASIFQNWQKADIPIWNPETNPEHYSYFQNFAFDFNGYHFIGLDFNYRDDALWLLGVKPEGELYNFSSSTWNWFVDHLNDYLSKNPEAKENIVLLSHHPFREWKQFELPFTDIGVVEIGFSEEELDTVHNFLKDYKDKIAFQFAGHSHDNEDNMFFDEIMRIVETDANVKASLARIVQVYPDERINYSKMIGYGITVVAHSPVDLEITDPDGLKISKQINEILGTEYIEEDLDGDGDLDDWIGILDKKLGDYQIRVIPEPGTTPEETYTLEVSTLEDTFGYVPILLAENIPISEIPTEPYLFESKERKATQIIYTGELNGQYSDQINLSAVLSDIDSNPLINKTVIFEIGEQSISAITNENGIASAILTLNQVPGQYYLIEANFAGDEDYLPSTDSEYFEILKENTIINVMEKEGFVFDEVTLEAEIKDDDGQILLSDAEVEFKIDDKTLGIVEINENGTATISWQVDLIPKEITEAYLIEVIFAGNDYYQSATGQADFILKSAKWLKEDAILELELIKTGDKKFDKEVDKIIWFINQSLNENLWIDVSRLVFFEKGKCENLNLEKILDKDELDLDDISFKCLKSGIAVFYYEKIAVKSMMPKPVFEAMIGKLVKADKLLAQVSLFDAKNTPIKNPKLQKIVESQIKKAEEEIQKAEKELEKNRFDKAIMRFSKSWLHSQLAIKLANLEIKL